MLAVRLTPFRTEFDRKRLGNLEGWLFYWIVCTSVVRLKDSTFVMRSGDPYPMGFKNTKALKTNKKRAKAELASRSSPRATRLDVPHVHSTKVPSLQARIASSDTTPRLAPPIPLAAISPAL